MNGIRKISKKVEIAVFINDNFVWFLSVFFITFSFSQNFSNSFIIECLNKNLYIAINNVKVIDENKIIKIYSV